MRRISINRYKAKVRGVDRRLRALDRWAYEFENCNPPHEGQMYWNYKIPVLDRLVNPPTTKAYIQGKAIESLLTAAVFLANSKVKEEVPYYRVAVLLTLPYMFQSEVTVFYDELYYNRFYHQKDLLPDSKKPSNVFNFEIPQSFVEVGTLVKIEDGDEDGSKIQFTEEWWTIGQEK